MEADLLESRRAPTLPSAGVGRLRWPVVAGPHGWVFDADGRFVTDASWYGSATEEVPLPEHLPGPTVIDGRCALLCSEWAGENFGHFLLDLLPRLHLLESSGALEEVDHVLVPPLGTVEARTLLDRSGIHPDRLIELGPGEAITASDMVVTTFPGRRRTTPRWAVAYLRRRFTDTPHADLPPAGPRPADTGPALIYLARGDHARAPVNEGAVISALEDLGFTTVYADRQPGNALFAGARVVVGPNAAALSNVVFCRPGSSLVELVPSDHQYPYFLSAALAAGVDYVGVGCPSLAVRPGDAPGPSSSDFVVDLDVLVPLVTELVGDDGPERTTAG